MALIGSIEHYDPARDDFEAYMERMELFFEVNCVTEKQVSFFITLIGPDTYAILRNLLVPESPKSKSLAELKLLLSNHFTKKTVTVAEWFKFHKRDQKQSETISEYTVALKSMAKSCNFNEFLSEALRDRLVCGISCQAIQNRLLEN